MRYDWTPAVTRALQAAEARARGLGAPAVRPEDLLHGLLAEEEGRAASLPAQAGADVAGARRALEGRPAAGPPQPAGTPLPLGPAAQAALVDARGLAPALDRTVPSEAVLLALLRRERELRALLESCGLGFD